MARVRGDNHSAVNPLLSINIAMVEAPTELHDMAGITVHKAEPEHETS